MKKNFSKIILLICAHGREKTNYVGNNYDKYLFHIPTDNIKIMNCGGGSSGSLTITDGNTYQST